MSINQKLTSLLATLPEGVKIDRSEQHEHAIELFVSWEEPSSSDTECPYCSSAHVVKKDAGTFQTVRHLNVGFYGTFITFHKPRFRCKHCGHTFYMKPEWVHPYICITQALLGDIYRKLTSTPHSIAEIARETNTSSSIVRSVMDSVDTSTPLHLPETLGIDEFKGNSGYYDKASKKYIKEKYHCVITSAASGHVIDILYKANYSELMDYFSRFSPLERSKVRYFCTDMRGGFLKVGRQCFPNARICVDPFHVVQLITKAVSTIRVDGWHRLRNAYNSAEAELKVAEKSGDKEKADDLKDKIKKLKDDYELVKNSQKLLITSPYNSNRYWSLNIEKREEKLAAVFALVPDLKPARDALISFYDVAHIASHSERHSALSSWITKYFSCELPPIRQAAYSIRKNRIEIENAWRYNQSNSPTEGLNKRIKDVKRLAFGLHDFETFRKRALLACGAISFNNPSYTIKDEKLYSKPVYSGSSKKNHKRRSSQ